MVAKVTIEVERDADPAPGAADEPAETHRATDA